jgi:catechol 2,3-dioxygenase-like lactoylglutathione lyase family enzyme
VAQLTGFNHLTLSVADLDRAFEFYVDLLGAVPRARWLQGAYLSIGELWLCLTLEANVTIDRHQDYTHYAFSCDDMAALRLRLVKAGVPQWQQNRSEGESLYITDPDGHRLEIHDGDLASRLAACRARPYAGMTFFDPAP